MSESQDISIAPSSSDRRIEKNEELLASYIDTWEASLADHKKRQVSDSLYSI